MCRLARSLLPRQPRPAPPPLVTIVLAAVLAACGGRHASDPGGSALAQGWNPVDGMRCADGTPTGLGVSLGTRDAVLLVLAGGGACWDDATCGGALRGPFGATEYAYFSSAFRLGTILDRNLAGNPFADWTLVLVPYCTGDVHAGGDVARTHGGVSWQHRGHANLAAAVARVAAAFPSPERVAVLGVSAGGFGAFLAFDLARTAWPGGAGGPRAYLVDDSGPTLVGDDVPAAVREAWWTAWNLDATITPLCAGCRSDLSALWPVLHAAHPGDRLSLLSTTRDAVMRGYFGVDEAAFETGLARLADELGRLAPEVATFRVSGTGHVLTTRAATARTAAGTTLLSWLSAQVSDAPGWTSAGP